MFMFIFMFIVNLLIPLTMLIFGLIFANHAPDEIDPLFGYRTPRSMINLDTWQFAHHLFGKIWAVAGAVTLPLTVVSMLVCLGKSEGFISNYGLAVSGVQVVVMLGTLLPVEMALKRTFDDNGKRRK